ESARPPMRPRRRQAAEPVSAVTAAVPIPHRCGAVGRRLRAHPTQATPFASGTTELVSVFAFKLASPDRCVNDCSQATNLVARFENAVDLFRGVLRPAAVILRVRQSRRPQRSPLRAGRG